MAITVTFIDTSVLCNIIPVPTKDQDHDSVLIEMKSRLAAGEVFILPMTTVIETGNHIAQISNGDARRKAAVKFSGMLQFVIEEKAPWTLHQIEWGKDFLTLLNDGCNTGSSLVQHAVAEVGTGDLCILAEREEYKKRTKIHNVQIWTLDVALSAYS